MHRPITALLLALVFALSVDAELVPKDAAPEKVADGYKFTEGPALGPDGCIYFTDIPASLILKFDPKTKNTTIFRENTERTNGLMWYDNDLYACSHGARAVRYYILNPRELKALKSREQIKGGGVFADDPEDPTKPQVVEDTTLVAIDENIHPRGVVAKKLNSPNDLAIDRSGNIYFTDPRYGNRDNMELDFEGVYYHGDAFKDNNPHRIYTVSKLIDADITRPNGIVLSPDESTLYVADQADNFIYAYDVIEPGRVENKRVFARLNDGKGHGSDGMCVDRQGRLYATGHGKVWIFEPTGELVATIPVGKQTTNCTFGADGKTLYITANKGLYRITLNTDAPLEHAEEED